MIPILRELYCQKKLLFDWPVQEDWVETQPDRVIAKRFKLILALADAHCASIEGLYLILEFDALAPHDGVAVLMIASRVRHHLGRFDFGKAEIHSNRKATSRGVPSLEALVRGSHIHPFETNAMLGLDAFKPGDGCPPAAVPYEDSPPSFRERMRAVAAEFMIEGLFLLRLFRGTYCDDRQSGINGADR